MGHLQGGLAVYAEKRHVGAMSNHPGSPSNTNELQKTTGRSRLTTLGLKFATSNRSRAKLKSMSG
jgi:hypothetical protein